MSKAFTPATGWLDTAVFLDEPVDPRGDLQKLHTQMLGFHNEHLADDVYLSEYATIDMTGATDSSTAFQTAVTALTGKKVHIGKGTILLNTAINLPDDIIIQGQGDGTVIKLGSGDINGFVMSAKSGVVIKDLKMLCEAAGTTVVGGVHFSAVTTNCTVENVTFEGFSYAGVIIDNSNHNTVRNCRVINGLGVLTSSSDILIEQDSSHNLVENCYLNGGSCWGVMITDPYTSTYPKGNKVINNHIEGHKGYGVAVYITTFYDTQTIIANNTIKGILGSALEGASGAGVFIQSAGGVIVDGNHISDCCSLTTNFFTLAPAGIGVTGSSSVPCVISNNIITDMTKGPGIHVNASEKGCIITGNTIEIDSVGALSNERCIFVSHSCNMIIKGNIIRQKNSNWPAVTIVANPYTFPEGGATSEFINTDISDNIINSVNKGIVFGVVTTGTFKRVTINNNTVVSTDIGMDIQKITNCLIIGNNINSTDWYPIYGNTLNYTRVSANVLITGNAARGVTWAGTGAGNYVDSSNYFTGLYESDSTAGFITEFYSNILIDGIWNVGDRIIKSIPVVGEQKGWRCTVAGRPGTWVSEGNL